MIDINSPALIPLLFLLAAILIPLVAFKKKWLAYPLAMMASLFSISIAILNIFKVIKHGSVSYHFGGWNPPIGIEYVLDHLSAFITLVINFVALFVLIHSKNVIDLEVSEKQMPYYALVMLMLSGCNGIVLTGDLFNLYVFLEISALSFYGLIAVGEKQSSVAAFRYLIMGTIGASFYLLGVGFLYTVTGSLNMADVKNILPFIQTDPTVFIALCLMITGIGIKMAVFPLHGWLPDAYTYAPSASSALIAPIGTKIGAYVILRVMFFIFGVGFVTKIVPVADVLCWLAAIGIIYGSVMAIAQRELKRMLAYSSVAQIGYIGMGIGLANPLGLIGAILHVLNHAFMKACLFLVAGSFRAKLGHSNIFRLNDSIRKRMPWTMAAFSVAALSMVGLPPLAGFFSKWYLALGTIKNSNWIFLGIILLSSLLNAVYFFRVLEKVYMKSPEEDKENRGKADQKRDEVTASMLIPTLVLGGGLILLGLFNAIIVKLIIARVMPEGLG